MAEFLAWCKDNQIGAVLGMKVEDIYTQSRRLWVRLREKGGKAHAVLRHHNLETYLSAYNGSGLTGDPKWPLFRTIGCSTGRPLSAPSCSRRTPMR